MEETLRTRLEGAFEEAFGPLEGRRLLWVRSPGRTEIAGNHTDHEGGDVIAAAVTRYIDGLFSPCEERCMRILSEGYPLVEIALDEDLSPREDERHTTAALVRGMAAQFKERGAALHGFEATVCSGVLGGSGLSSSAAFELLLGCAMCALWYEGKASAEELAIMGQHAEREWFGKPCGLMDQAAVALGGITHMSFRNEGTIDARHIDFDFREQGYAIAIIAVGDDHSANTDDYASVPREMQQVAALLGVRVLSEVTETDPTDKLPMIRKELGDRALLRAIHYFNEMRLVKERVEALESHDMPAFLGSTRESGESSAMYLQNVSVGGAQEQPSMVGIAMAELLLGTRGAQRVHGGGFGGTIQAFVPLDEVESFSRRMDAVFGEGACDILDIDHEGARALWLQD